MIEQYHLLQMEISELKLLIGKDGEQLIEHEVCCTT